MSSYGPPITYGPSIIPVHSRKEGGVCGEEKKREAKHLDVLLCKDINVILWAPF